MKSHLKHRNLKKFVSNASNLRHYLLPTLTTRANLINFFFFFLELKIWRLIFISVDPNYQKWFQMAEKWFCELKGAV